MKKIVIILAIVLATGYCYGESQELFEYASRGDFENVRRYKNAGGDLHALDDYGSNALLVSAENGYTDIVKYLLANKVEVNILNQYGYTPLFAAVTNEHTEVIKLLIASGANVNFKNQYNSSPLDYMNAMGAKSPEAYLASLANKPPSAMRGPNSFFYLRGWEKRAMAYMDEHKTELAVASISAAADVGDHYAQYLIGKMYMEKGVTDKGVAYLTLAADNGIVDALYLLGVYYSGGYDPIDGKRGLAYLELAASAAHGGANAACGRCYLLGIGTKRDVGVAKSYLEKGIQLGSPDAEYYLGVMHYYELGAPRDKDKGYSLIVSAAGNGSAEAERQLARFATEDSFSYLLGVQEFTRTSTKAYMLSQGALHESETAECDSYAANGSLDDDYGVYEVDACFPADLPPNMIFKVDANIHNIYKEYLLNYQLKAPVRFDVSEKERL